MYGDKIDFSSMDAAGALNNQQLAADNARLTELLRKAWQCLHAPNAGFDAKFVKDVREALTRGGAS